jgi:hypothetical protein
VSPVGFLCGLTVHQVRVGYDLRLMSSDAKWQDENDVEIVMEAPYLVTDPAGTEHRVELDKLGTIPALLALHPARLRTPQPMTAHFVQPSMTAVHSRSRLSMSTRHGVSRDQASA